MNKIMFDKEKLRLIRRYYLTAILWTLIIELVVWVLVILFSDSVYDPVIGKFQTMFLVFVVCALLNVGAFKCMEVGNNGSRAFAITSLVTSVIATILDLFLIWEVFPALEKGVHFGNNDLSVASKITLSIALTSIASLLEANILMSINSRKSTKIFASVILGFLYICFLVAIIGIDLTNKMSLLVVVVPIATLLIYFVATRITKLEDITDKKVIEEKAIKEVEKNSRIIEEKKLAERKKVEEIAPLQAENMPASFTSGVRIDRPSEIKTEDGKTAGNN